MGRYVQVWVGCVVDKLEVKHRPLGGVIVALWSVGKLAQSLLISLPSPFHTPSAQVIAGHALPQRPRTTTTLAPHTYNRLPTPFQHPAARWAMSFLIDGAVGACCNAVVTWLILPAVICLSQRLSHACASVSFSMARL